MVDTDTFLTVLYVMADDFCKRHPQHRPTPGPKASLTESEVITLVIFGQWVRFRSEMEPWRLSSAAWPGCCRDGAASTKRWTVPAFPQGTPNAGAPAGRTG